MNVLGLHHAQITVPDGAEPAAREFYLRVLGMREIEKPKELRPRGFWCEFPSGQQLHVQFEDGVDRRATRAHLAYLVDDVAAFRERLERQGVVVEHPPRWPGHPRVQFRDPFGNYVELIQLEPPMDADEHG